MLCSFLWSFSLLLRGLTLWLLSWCLWFFHRSFSCGIFFANGFWWFFLFFMHYTNRLIFLFCRCFLRGLCFFSNRLLSWWLGNLFFLLNFLFLSCGFFLNYLWWFRFLFLLHSFNRLFSALWSFLFLSRYFSWRFFFLYRFRLINFFFLCRDGPLFSGWCFTYRFLCRWFLWSLTSFRCF